MSNLKLIILDRDGVINEDSPEYIKSPQEWHAIPGSLEAIAQLNRAGYIVVVATNQSGIARGYFSSQTLDAIHAKMHKEIAEHGGKIDGIFICPHGPKDDCTCRKPKPGLLQQIGEHFKIPASQTLVIGDSIRDLEAAKAYGAEAILVLTGKGQHAAKSMAHFPAVAVYKDLAAAVSQLIMDN